MFILQVNNAEFVFAICFSARLTSFARAYFYANVWQMMIDHFMQIWHSMTVYTRGLVCP